MVKYPANGSASDWMLGVRGIYAMTPELGTSDPATESFFNYSADTLKSILTENYPWIKSTMLTISPKPE